MNFIKRITDWEQWPFKVLYAPLVPIWLYYIIRSRAIWFFTPSNPKLTFGGMEGEPKKEMHDLLPEKYRPVYFNVAPGQPVDAVLQTINQMDIGFPLIVKPEVGCQGILMRKLETADDLRFYHQQMKVEYIVQKFVTFPMEVSLFYYRYPWKEKGNITGFLQKIPLKVQGDGLHTLEELILRDNKSKKRVEELRKKHGALFQKVLAPGEEFKLSDAANHNRGARFVDLSREIDNTLVSLLDEISLSVNDFFYGRYDILCNSVEDLKRGENFVILEYNGCGAEPNHFYDTGYSLRRAYLEIIMHWKKLFSISRYNHKSGITYWPFIKGLRFLKETDKHFKIIRELDRQIP